MTAATPKIIAPLTSEPISYVSGFSDGLSLSVESDIVTKKAEMSFLFSRLLRCDHIHFVFL